jgi:hypothetical protein
MSSVQACTLPAGTLLESYVRSGAYTDCYVVELARPVSQGEFIEAFYTTPIFKVERWLLANILSRPSTDLEARQLGLGSSAVFAAWSVEQRDPNQVLLASGRTRSWLMASAAMAGPSITKLYFGSAVVARRSVGSSTQRMGWQFKALLGFHRLYSRILLAAARRKLAAIG